MVAQEEVKGVRILAPEEVRCIKQRYFKDQESQKGIKKELRDRATTSAGVFFLQIRFLRVA